MIKSLSPLDTLFVLYHLLLTAFVLVGASSLRLWPFLAVWNLFFAASLVFLAYASRRLPQETAAGRLLRFIHV
jgi:hypothetical protein